MVATNHVFSTGLLGAFAALIAVANAAAPELYAYVVDWVSSHKSSVELVGLSEQAIANRIPTIHYIGTPQEHSMVEGRPCHLFFR
jgi:hypothetical protein